MELSSCKPACKMEYPRLLGTNKGWPVLPILKQQCDVKSAKRPPLDFTIFSGQFLKLAMSTFRGRKQKWIWLSIRLEERTVAAFEWLDYRLLASASTWGYYLSTRRNVLAQSKSSWPPCRHQGCVESSHGIDAPVYLM